MDAKSMRSVADAANKKKRQEQEYRWAQWEAKEKRDRAQGATDGKDKIYKKCLAEIEKAAKEGRYFITYSFSNSSEAYTKAVLSTLPVKLKREGFEVGRVPSTPEYHRYPGYRDGETGQEFDDSVSYSFSFEVRC